MNQENRLHKIMDLCTGGFLLISLLAGLLAYYQSQWARELKTDDLPRQKKHLQRTKQLANQIRAIRKKAPPDQEQYEERLQRLEVVLEQTLQDAGSVKPETALGQTNRIPLKKLADQPYRRGGLEAEINNVPLSVLMKTLYSLEQQFPVLKTFRINLMQIEQNNPADRLIKKSRVQFYYFLASEPSDE